MTKEQYFEMCTAMGYEPEEDRIPVDFEDLFTDVQEAFIIYARLQDTWDSMNGIYLGKNLLGIKDLFEILEIPREDWKTVLDLITIIDGYRADEIRREAERNKNKNPT